MLVETEQSLFEVVSKIREFIQGVQYWSGGFPIAISHCFLRPTQCGSLVEITTVENWLRFVNFHCMGCDEVFRIDFLDFGLVS